MIAQLVLLQPKAEIPQEEILTALYQLQALPQTVPVLTSIQIVQNRRPSPGGYTYGYLLRCAAQEDLTTLVAHPVYQQARKHLRRLCRTVMVFAGFPEVGPVRKRDAIKEEV